MKFLCPSCKAKYQIADEKVAGRSVRMKCRKCGFVIPISEVPPAPPTVRPPDGAAALPKVPPPPRDPSELGPPLVPPPPVAPRASVPRAAPSSPRAAPAPLARDQGALKGGVAPSPKAPAAAESGTAGVARRPAKPERSSPAVQARARAVAPGSASDLLPAVEDEAEEEVTHSGRGGLVAAFGALVAQAPASVENQSIAMPADEWYVGINDAPVGPIRLTELRAKAASGAVTLESLVWRDGVEDWRALRTFPELVAVVEESMSSVRASPAPLTAAATNGAAAKLDFTDAFVASPSAVTGPAVVTDDLVLAGLSRSRMPVAAWIAIAIAVPFGVVLGVVFFSKQTPGETIVKYVEVPAKGAEPASAAADNPGTKANEGDNPAEPATTAKPKGGGKTSGGKVAAAEPESKGGLSGLKGLDGLRPGSPGGPSGTTGSGSSTSSSSSSNQLEASQIQSTVARYTGSVKRSCWQPALDSRDPSAPTSARVVVSITVGPSGNVQGVTTSGEPRGYPGLASCIAGRVRGWQFPATGGTTTANVPFVFAAQ